MSGPVDYSALCECERWRNGIEVCPVHPESRKPAPAVDVMRAARPYRRGDDPPAAGQVCGRCGDLWTGYSLPPPYGGILDARYEMRVCDRCYGLFVQWCGIFFGRDLPPESWRR